MKVSVYFNLHKKCFSVRHKGIVMAHSNEVFIKNARFKVSEAGRKRVLKEKRKNVHAYVVGEVSTGQIKDGIELTYNPYLHKNFVTKIEQRPVGFAKFVMLSVTSDKKARIIAEQIG